jgi:hypothetical protein
MRTICLLVMSLLFCLCVEAQPSTEKRVQHVVRAELLLAGQHKWSVVILQKRKKLSKNEFDQLADSGYPFGLGTVDDYYVREINFKRNNGAPQTAALSSFADLFNPVLAKMQSKGENVLLTIEGGDAAFSYVAELEIAPYGVLTRRVRNRISGYEENTAYTYPENYVKSFKVPRSAD